MRSERYFYFDLRWRRIPFVFPFAIILAALLLQAGPSLGEEDGPRRIPFRPGETLSYEVRWEFIPAARTVLKILPMETIGGEPAWHFSMTVETLPFADAFYKVRDRIDAYASADMAHSLLFRQKQREGGYKKEIETVFDWSKPEVRYSNFGKPRSPLPLPPGAFDPLSVFYSFRLHELKENGEIRSYVTDGKKCKMGVARILSKERIKTPAGEFDAWLAEPDLKDIGGVFKKSDDAKLRIWVTADGRSIRVRIESKVVVGRFVAELTSMDVP